MMDCYKKQAHFFPRSNLMLIDLVKCQLAGAERENRGRELVWICAFLPMVQLIDETVCGQRSWTHLLLFQAVVRKS